MQADRLLPHFILLQDIAQIISSAEPHTELSQTAIRRQPSAAIRRFYFLKEIKKIFKMLCYFSVLCDRMIVYNYF